MLLDGTAVILIDSKINVGAFSVTITFPSGSSTEAAGVALFHDGANNYSAVTLDKGSSSIEHLDFTSGSGWASPVAVSDSITINNETSYELRGFITQRHVTAWVVGQSNQVVYDRSTSRTRNRFGLVATKTGVTFDNFKLYQPTPHDPAARSSF